MGRPAPARQTALGALLLFASAAAGACGDGRSSGAALLDGHPRHLLLITLGGVRADHTSAYRYPRPTTAWPTDGAQHFLGRALALDDLAAEGLVCTEAWAPAVDQLSSLKVLMTGRATPICEQLTGLEVSELTLAEQLAARGLRTAAFVSGAKLAVAGGFDQGFETFLHRDTDEEALRWAVRWLGDQDLGDGRGLFLWLHLAGPEAPWEPGVAAPTPGPVADKLDYMALWLDPSLRSVLPVVDYGELYGPRAAAGPIDLYDGELAELSSRLRSFLLGYRSLGRPDALFEDTALVVAGLGGTELGEHGWADSLYAPYVRVPLIFHHPATVPGRRYSASLISLEDLAPTALHWLRLEGPPEAHRRRGRSLVRLLEDNQAPEPRSAVCVGRDGVQCASFRDGRYTLVWTNTPEGELTELYDRGLDPLELRDLAVWRPQLVQKLRNELVWLLTEVEL